MLPVPFDHPGAGKYRTAEESTVSSVVHEIYPEAELAPEVPTNARQQRDF